MVIDLSVYDVLKASTIVSALASETLVWISERIQTVRVCILAFEYNLSSLLLKRI